MIGRVFPPLLMLLSLGAIYWGWRNFDLLRDTPLWEFRFIVFAVAVFIFLSLVQFVSNLFPSGSD